MNKQTQAAAPLPTQNVMLIHTLRKTPIFSGLESQSLEKLIRGCQLQRFPKGSYLFHEQAPASGFYVVHSGSVNVHRVTEDGREQVIRVFYPGESLGEVVIAGDRTFPASAKTPENSQVILIPTAFFREQIMADPDLALRILASMSSHLRFLVETIEDLKLKHAESRVTQWLLRQAAEATSPPDSVQSFHLPLAKHLLASQLGITSETLSRVFLRLREAGLVEVDGKQVHITDLAGLKQFLANPFKDNPGQPD